MHLWNAFPENGEIPKAFLSNTGGIFRVNEIDEEFCLQGNGKYGVIAFGHVTCFCAARR